MLASLSSWLTPSSLFLLLNIVIGTIYLISRLPSSGRSHNHQAVSHYHQIRSDYNAPPLARAPSLLERVKSIDLNFYKFAHHQDSSYGHQYEQQYIPPPQIERAQANSVLERVKSIDFFHKFAFPSYDAQYHPTEQAYHAPPLQERPSMLERVKSIEFFHKFSHPNQTDRFPHSIEPEYTAPPPLERAPSLLDRVKSINFSLNKFTPSYPDPHFDAREPDLQQSNRPPSLLERVKSIDFASFYKSDSVSAIHETEFPPEPEFPTRKPVKKSKSEKNVTQRKAAPEKMKKSVSQNSRLHEDEEDEDAVERRRPATTGIERTVTTGEKGDVDAKADDFINKFKQQLMLQRMESITRNTNMLKKK